MNPNELERQYREALIRAEGESANEGSEVRDPDAWLLARGSDGYGASARQVQVGGADEAAIATVEQAVAAANRVIAQLQTANTAAQQLVVDLRARLAELDDVETFAQNVNFYRQKQQELETLLGQLNQTRAATEQARDEAQIALRGATQERGIANMRLAEVSQEYEANEHAIAEWRQQLGNSNNVYTGLNMLGLTEAATFAEMLDAMATPSVGYFSFEFVGDEVPREVSSTMGPDREFLPDWVYQVFLTLHKTQLGYMATLCWTAHDSNGVYVPVTFEDRVEMGMFNTGWAVRSYQANSPCVFNER